MKSFLKHGIQLEIFCWCYFPGRIYRSYCCLKFL
jgi:hypothetical protein